MSSFSVGLVYAGIGTVAFSPHTQSEGVDTYVGMGYLYLMMGVVISGAVIPVALVLLWKDMNWQAAVGSPMLALMSALTAWLVTAHTKCGELSVNCTGSNYPMLAGESSRRSNQLS
jgi:hypothetical protein